MFFRKTLVDRENLITTLRDNLQTREMPPRQSPRKGVSTHQVRISNGIDGQSGSESSMVEGIVEPVPTSKKRLASSSLFPGLSKRHRASTTTQVTKVVEERPLADTSLDRKRQDQPTVNAEIPSDRKERSELEELIVKPVPRSKRARAKNPNADSLGKDGELTITASDVNFRRTKSEAVLVKEQVDPDAIESPKKTRRVQKSASTTTVVKEEEIVQAESQPGKKKHRKTKAEKEQEAMPLAARTAGLRMYIGAHVSCAKGHMDNLNNIYPSGVHNSVTNAVHIGGNSFACFLKSQRKWENPPLQDEHKDQFHSLCAEHKYEASKHVVPHGSYLVNLAQNDTDKAKQAYDAFIDDLKRCESLGITLYNFHPGSTLSLPRSEAIGRIAAALNRAHKETRKVKPVLENMAGQGNVIGATFEDLRDIIEQVEDKSRIGVCIDTCHTFAAGYDLRTPEAFKRTMDQFDKIVGMQYLSALHINDSKGPFNSHRDLHQNIGLGFLGLRAFHNVMNEHRFENLPLVLETPIDAKGDDGKIVEDRRIWATEIKLLESLIGMDPESEVFQCLERDLAAKGAAERVKLQDVFERKQLKDRKAAEKGRSKTKKPARGQDARDDSSAGGLSDISD
ncbi:hypothetical protein MMC13_002052 [Lambiella insularis]|nr:hypothetical protein [Lambiella insularis]